MEIVTACNGSIKFQILPSYPINEDECSFKSGALETKNVTIELTGAGSSGVFTEVTPPGEPDPRYRFTGVIVSSSSQICATATVSISSGFGATCEKTGTVCFTPEPGIYIGTESCDQKPNFSEFAAYFDNAPDNLPVYLLSSLNFDVSHTTDRVWNIVEGASIIVSDGANLQLAGANFSSSSCDQLWQGIIAEDNATVGLTDEAVISDAAFAIASYWGANANISVSNSTLSKNYEGIHVEFNDSDITVENSKFTSPELKPLNECISGVNTPDLCGRGYAGINIQQGAHLFIQNPNNYFELGNGVLLQDTRATIQNQSFVNVFEQCFLSQGGYSIKTLNTSTFPAWGYFQFNTFTNTDFAIQAQDQAGFGDFHIRQNTMIDVYRGADVLLLSQAVDDNYSMIFGNNILSLTQGHFLPQRTDPIGIVVVTNDLEPSTLWSHENNINVQEPNSMGIYYLHLGNTSRLQYSEIFRNTFTLSDDADQTGIRLDGEIGSSIYENTLVGAGNPEDRIGVYTRRGNGNQLCDNSIDFNTTGVGIEVMGTQSQSISYNTLSGGEYGAKLDQNCIPQGIDANTIEGNPSIGFYHQSNAGLDVTDDQLDKRNNFPSGVMEVTTDGEEQYLTQAFSGPTSLGDSPFSDRGLTGLEGIRSCTNVTGDITAPGFGGGGTDGPSDQDDPVYADMYQRIAEGNLNGDLGRDFDYQKGLYTQLRKSSSFDAQFSDFYETQNQGALGILNQAKSALERPTITPEERDFLNNARLTNDFTGVPTILERASILNAENISAALELINNIQEGSLPELTLRDARAALLNTKPSYSKLADWKTIGEGCYAEYGPAVYEFQRAYFAVTGQILESRCLEGRMRTPNAKEEESRNSSTGYSLAPSITSSTVSIIGLTEPVDIRVVDLYGRTLKQIQSFEPGQQIDLQNLPAAQYFIILDDSGHAPLSVIVK